MSSSSASVVVQEKETHTGAYPTFSKFTVTATDSQAAYYPASSAVLSVSSPAAGQTLHIPVTLTLGDHRGSAMQGESWSPPDRPPLEDGG